MTFSSVNFRFPISFCSNKIKLYFVITSYYKLISILYYFIDISPASDCVRRVFVDRNNLKYDRNVINEYIYARRYYYIVRYLNGIKKIRQDNINKLKRLNYSLKRCQKGM